MAKFHIGRGGKAAICSAKKGNCPFGSDDEHFKTREEAKNAAEKKLSDSHGILNSANKDSITKENNTLEKDIKENDYSGSTQYDRNNLDHIEKRKEAAQEVYKILDDIIYPTVGVYKFSNRELLNKCIENIDKFEHIGEKEYVEDLILDIQREYAELDEDDENYKLLMKIKDNVINGEEKRYKRDKRSLKKLPDAPKLDSKILEYLEDEYDLNNNTSHPSVHELVGYAMKDPSMLEMHKDLGDGYFYIRCKKKKQPRKKQEYADIVYYAPSGNLAVEDVKNLNNFMNMTPKGYHDEDNKKNIVFKNIFSGITKEESDLILGKSEERKLENLHNVTSLNSEIGKYIQKNNKNSHINSLANSEQPLKYALSEIAVYKNIHDKNTSLHKMYPDKNFETIGSNMKEKSDYYRGGIVSFEEQNNDIVKRYRSKKNRELFQEANNAFARGNFKDDIDVSKEERKRNLGYDRDINNAIRLFTNSSYKEMSKPAFGVEYSYTSHDIIEEEKLLNDTLREKQSQNTEPRMIYRGFEAPRHMTAQEYYDSIKVGEVITNTKTLSASASPAVAKRFSDGVNSKTSNANKTKPDEGRKIVVHMMHTKKGGYIAPQSEFSEEKEVAIPTGEQFVCVGKSIDEQGRIIMHFADNEKM